MYLTRLRLNSVRLFKEPEFPFLSDSDDARMWTIFLGNNATGKSTLLRSLAIGLSDLTSAAGLVRELKSSLVRGKSREARIEVELIDSNGQLWTLKTVLKPLKKTGDRVTQEVFRKPLNDVGESDKGEDPGVFPWEKLFVVGYGAGRTVAGTEEYSKYRMVDAVYTLFRYDQPLQSPELAWYRLLQKAESRKRTKTEAADARARADRRIQDLIASVLLLEPGATVRMTEGGIRIKAFGGDDFLADYADGYRATTTWVLDLIAWNMLYRGGISPARMGGIVIVDELEQHLHPRWQRYLVPRLQKLFPKVQFVTTTHSPLCAAGAADLTESQCALFSLRRDSRTNTTTCDRVPLPRGFRADQVLTSDAFRLEETRNPELGNKVERFHVLFEKRARTETEEREFRKLQRELDKVLPAAAQFPYEQQLRDELMELTRRALRTAEEKVE